MRVGCCSRNQVFAGRKPKCDAYICRSGAPPRRRTKRGILKARVSVGVLARPRLFLRGISAGEGAQRQSQMRECPVAPFGQMRSPWGGPFNHAHGPQTLGPVLWISSFCDICQDNINCHTQAVTCIQGMYHRNKDPCSNNENFQECIRPRTMWVGLGFTEKLTKFKPTLLLISAPSEGQCQSQCQGCGQGLGLRFGVGLGLILASCLAFDAEAWVYG